MPNAELTPEQAFALIDELETAAKMTQYGMDALHDLDAANDFHHLPMQLLSQGFERLLKVTYALAVREHSGELPTVAEFKRRYGHDLTKINSALIELVASNDEYANRPVVRDDLDFLSTDPDLARVLKLLSSFGTWSRYYNLGVLLDPSSVADENDPALAWQAMEHDALQGMPNGIERLGQPAEQDDLFQEIYEEIAKTLDRFTRAISRMWTLGPLGSEGQRHMGLIKEFLFLRDEELGQPR
jgi:hypothetical protein